MHIAILCDFDDTISRINVGDFLYEQFASCGLEHALKWRKGEISSKQEFLSTFATVTASKEKMEAAISSVEIDPGFKSLIDFSSQMGYELAIVSDGLEWYISYVLAQHDIHDVPIYANQIHFEDGAYRFEFPWYRDETPLRGVCKPEIVRRFQNPGTKVVYIGDGLTDVDAVGVADFVYAKDNLLKHCIQQRIPAMPFTTLSEVVQNWIAS